MSPPFLPATFVLITSAAVNLRTLTFGEIGLPITVVCVSVGIFHGAMTTLFTSSVITGESVSVHVDRNAVAMRTATAERHIEVGGAKVRFNILATIPHWVDGGRKVGIVLDDISTITTNLDRLTSLRETLSLALHNSSRDEREQHTHETVNVRSPQLPRHEINSLLQRYAEL